MFLFTDGKGSRALGRLWGRGVPTGRARLGIHRQRALANLNLRRELQRPFPSVALPLLASG